MLEKLRLYKKIIFAEGENFTMEERIILSTAIIGIVTSFLGALINFILTTSLLAILTPLVLMLLLSFIYYFFRFKKFYRPFVKPMVLIAYIGISVIWISNGGMDGSNIMPALVILILTIIALPKQSRFYFTLIFIILFSANFTIQYYYPKFIIHFPSERDRWIDAIITLAYSSVFLYFIINYLIKQYNIEKNKVETSEKKLLELNNELVHLNNSKDKFFSIIAHDLRGPLTVFRDMLDLINDVDANLEENEKRELIEVMKKSASNLNNLFNNLLEWSQIQQGVMEFEPQKVDLNVVITDAIEVNKISSENKSITIQNTINKEIFAKVDAHMISTVFRNLISNAIKFTDENGRIEIALKNQENFFQFSVKDNGSGIDKKLMNDLFKIDIKTTTLGTKGERGTGLGLMLCKEFVEKHGGKIWVESTLGEGSTFYFTIPKKI